MLLQTLSFLIFGQRVQVVCSDGLLASAVAANYSALTAEFGEHRPDLHYILAGTSRPGEFLLTCRDRAAVTVLGMGRLLFDLEKDLTIALQQRRPDLLFLHAAALESSGNAYLLAGDSGHGKSTAAWGLLHHGFRYMSDELSPIDLCSLRVLPYPRALHLKRLPPPGYPLPVGDILDFGATLQVPVPALPAAAVCAPCALGAVIFVRYQAGPHPPVLRAISPAEAGARMYVTVLNALAHPGHGLDAVVHLAERVPCFSLRSADLRVTCEVVSKAFATPGPK
ncbi:MAG: hypothetical protein H0U56_05450 [Methylibium sp.]|nr:hypothetical protein [Methylibium sp.]